MSRGLPSHMLLFIIAFVYTVTAAPLNPSGGLDSFVPSCAIQCFDSFLNISYGDQTARTLEALCALIGAHGFTIAEAAVQCLVAERAAGACSYQVASNTVIDKAYFMCYGQPGALSPTHSVLTATFGVPVHGTGPITFPAVATTGRQTSIPTAISRETQSSISLPTTLVTDTTSLPAPRPSMTGSTPKPTATTTTGRTTIPSTTSFRSSTSTSTQAEAVTTDPTSLAFTKTTAATTETSTGTSVPNGIVGGQGEKKASTPLSNGQVAGIAIGSIAGVGLIGAGIAVFCRCLRRRRSQFGRKMRKDGRLLRDSWGGPEKPNGDGGTDSWIVNQLRAPLDPGPASTPTKSWYNRASWRPSAIGLAITPTRTRDVSQAATPTSARPLSKLLPAKPTMGQGPPRLEVSLPSQEGDSHFGAAAFMSTAAASGAVMSGAIPASSSPKGQQPTTTKQFVQTRNLTPPRIVLPSPDLDSPRGKPQSPLLKLIIPKKGAFKPFVPIPIPNTRHDSSTTEFEEDGRTSLSPGGQIWRPPSAEPLSAAPYYVADKNGNWRLGDPRRAQEIAELEASISPLTAGPRSAAESLELVKTATRREATKAAAKIRAAEQSREDSLGMRMAPEKTIRAVEPSLSSDEEIQEQEQPYAPRPLFSNNNNGNNLTVPRRLSSHRRSSTRSLTRPRITSTDSNVTAFSTASTEDDAELRAPPAMEQVGSLSPVVESPRSPRPRRGQSPTQYPKIPASLTATTGNLNIEMATSKGGNAAAAAAAAVSPTQKSPNFRAPLAAATMSSNDGKSKRPMASSPNAIMAGSPRMRMQPNASSSSRPYPQPQQTQQMPYRLPPHPSAYRPNIDPSGYPYQTRLSAFNQGPMAYAPQQDRYPRQQQARPISQHHQQQQYYYPQSSSATSSFYPSDIPQAHHNPLLTRTSASTHISSSSAADSLLAKRLGTSRAADMALLPVPQPAMTASSSQNKWLRQGQQQQQQQQQQYQQPSTPEMPSPAELPATPVWKPRLTPTRRGDDLYLIAR